MNVCINNVTSIYLESKIKEHIHILSLENNVNSKYLLTDFYFQDDQVISILI